MDIIVKLIITFAILAVASTLAGAATVGRETAQRWAVRTLVASLLGALVTGLAYIWLL